MLFKSKLRILPNLFASFFKSAKIAGLLLIFCTILSLVLTNSAIGESYAGFMHHRMNLSFAGHTLNYSFEHFVNDGLMAIFFLMVGLEVERELYTGELAEFKKAILPVAAALGGVCTPALIHYLFNMGTPTQSGFAIPMATDIAFAVGVLGLAGSRVPVAVTVFLTALAVIDDICAIIVIALFYTQTIHFSYLLIGFGLLGFLFVLNRLKVQMLSIYLLTGVVIWYCFLQSGVHATISGVLLAFVIPFDHNNKANISNRLSHFLHKPVAFIIVPVFALVNTAIIIPPGIVATLGNPNSAGIILGLLVGKVTGIFVFPYLLVKSGLAKLQQSITWKYLVGIGLLGGIGFTMSIFITMLAFTDPQLVSSSKLSVLLGSTLSAIAGLLVFLSGPASSYKNSSN